VWGIRIPAWYSVDQNPDLVITFLTQDKQNITGKVSELISKYSFEEIEKGLQKLFAPSSAEFIIQQEKPAGRFLPETDTFDTWFSSGQWPLVTLGYPDSKDFKRYYPTDVLETGWEIIRLWVSRMIMFGIYRTGKSPFQDVYLHGIVKALDGRKMSKSLGNVISPEDFQKEFGTDALRMGLITGTATGKDFNFPKDKVLAYRNFANKVWNIGRFILMKYEENKNSNIEVRSTNKDDKALLKKLDALIKKTTQNLEKYRFAQAAEEIYHFVWGDIADKYIEENKNREDKDEMLSTLTHAYLTSLKLLHPFMPFVTEAIWQEIKGKLKVSSNSLMIETWPH
jgi:valyl-tRNA synthetase